MVAVTVDTVVGLTVGEGCEDGCVAEVDASSKEISSFA